MKTLTLISILSLIIYFICWACNSPLFYSDLWKAGYAVWTIWGIILFGKFIRWGFK